MILISVKRKIESILINKNDHQMIIFWGGVFLFLLLGFVLFLNPTKEEINKDFTPKSPIIIGNTPVSFHITGDDFYTGTLKIPVMSYYGDENDEYRLFILSKDMYPDGTVLNESRFGYGELINANGCVCFQLPAIKMTFFRDYYVSIVRIQGNGKLELSENTGPPFCQDDVHNIAFSLSAYSRKGDMEFIWRVIFWIGMTSLVISMILGVSFWKALGINITAEGIILYTLALINRIDLCIVIIAVSFVVMFSVLVYLCIIKHKKIQFHDSLKGQFICWLLLIFFFYIHDIEFGVYASDEANHWGTAVRNMYIFDRMYIHKDSTVNFYDYPPLFSLFQYFLMKIRGCYIDNTLYFTRHMLEGGIMLSVFDVFYPTEERKKEKFKLSSFIINNKFEIALICMTICVISMVLVIQRSFVVQENIIIFAEQIVKRGLDRSVWHYRFQNEWFIKIVLILLFYSLGIIGLFKNHKKKNLYYFQCFLVVVAVLMIPDMAIKRMYNTIFADITLGVVFGWLVVTTINYLEKDQNKWILLHIFIISLFVNLIKDNGMILCVSLIIGLIITCIYEKIYMKNVRNIRYISSTVVSFAGFVVARVSWEWYFKHNIANNSVGGAISTVERSGISSNPIKDFLTGHAPAYRYKIIFTHPLTLFKTPYYKYWGISLSFVMLLCVMLLLIRYYSKLENSGEVISRMVFVIASSIACVAIYHVVYTFTMPDYEGITFSGEDRYLGSWMLGIMMLLIIIIFRCSTVLEKNTALGMLVSVLIVIAVVTGFGENYVNGILFPRNQREVAYYSKKIRDLTREGDVIFYINHDEIEPLRGVYYRYYLTPVKIHSYEAKMPRLYNAGENEYILSEEDFISSVGRCDYLYIDKGDEKFIEEYGRFFENIEEIGDKGLYKVDNSQEGLILKYVDSFLKDGESEILGA